MCSLRKGKMPNGSQFFEVRDNSTQEVFFKLQFESKDEFNKWGVVLIESTKPDAALR